MDDLPADHSSLALLALAVVAVSASAVLIRGINDARPLAIAFWRCAAGGAVLAPFALRERRVSDRRTLWLSGTAGLLLALHFGAWITSLGLTSVSSSVLLVSTTPVFVAVLSWTLLNERLSKLGWAGIVLAVMGTAIIAMNSGGTGGQQSSAGDALALVGAIAIGGQLMLARAIQARLGVIKFAAITYSCAAIALGVVCCVTGVALRGYRTSTWLLLGAIVAGPQLTGHTLINLVVKKLDPTTVSMGIMAEPVLASVFAAALLNEFPSRVFYPAAALILIGIYMVMTAKPAMVVPTD